MDAYERQRLMDWEIRKLLSFINTEILPQMEGDDAHYQLLYELGRSFRWLMTTGEQLRFEDGLRMRDER